MVVLSLKRKGSKATDLIHQLSPDCLSCLDKKLTRYMYSKWNKFEEGEKTRATKLMSLTKYKYKTLVKKGQWEAPDAQAT